MSNTAIPAISPSELKAELESATPPQILDVREPDELEISRLPNVVHVPLNTLPGSVQQLDVEADWVVVCRSGMRSAQAAQFLMGHGFKRVRNLTCGMNEYARSADTSLTVY